MASLSRGSILIGLVLAAAFCGLRLLLSTNLQKRHNDMDVTIAWLSGVGYETKKGASSSYSRRRKEADQLSATIPGGKEEASPAIAFNLSAAYTCRNQAREKVTLPDQFPSFIVIGSQKGGTTAFTEIFKQHPRVMGNTKAPREPHFFDFVLPKQDHPYLDPLFLCSMRQKYITEHFSLDEYYRRSAKGPVFAFEKTPSYIRYVGTAYRTYKVLGKSVKLIAVIRNPVERSYSNYKMEILRGRSIDISYDALVRNETDALRRVGLTNAPPLDEFDEDAFESESSVYSFNPVNLSFAERRMIVHMSKTPQFGLLKKMKDNTIYAGMYATQLSEWLQYYELGTDLLVIHSEDLSQNTNQVLRRVQKFLGISPILTFPATMIRKDYNPLTLLRGVNMTDQVDKPSSRTLAYLKRFFKPLNDELADLLGEEWRGVWD